MKSICFLLLFALALPLICPGQQALPGGVAGLKAWCVAQRLSDGSTYWNNRLDVHPVLPARKDKSGASINFNAVMPLDGRSDNLAVPLGESNYSSSTVFTVYQAADSLGDKRVWTWTGDPAGQLTLGTRKLVDLSDSTQIAFAQRHGNFPVMNSYFQCKKGGDLPAGPQRIYLGALPEVENPGAIPFRGTIAEILVYNHFLDGLEKQKVETYLALKYGIPVSQDFEPTPYLSAEGDTIWNAGIAEKYNINITGFGRNDRSGLLQPKSTGSCNPGLLTLGIAGTAGQLADRSFLVWADNGKDLETGARVQGQPARLLRQWRIMAAGNVSTLETEVQFDAGQSESQPAPGECWWLCVDRSGSGKFGLGAVDYYKADSVSPTGTVFFSHVFWDTDRSGYDLFTLGTGPGLLAKVWATQPRCTPTAPGAFHIGAEGGRPPYRFSLRCPDSGFKQDWTAPDASTSDITGLEPGDYVLAIRDAQNTAVETHLYLESADAPVSGLASEYTLAPQEVLYLDASRNLPVGDYQYRWEGPEGITSTSPELRITAPGDYRLTIDRAGCLSSRDIRVIQDAGSNFKSIAVFPNPASSSNPVEIRIRLTRDAPVELTITDLSSAVLARASFHGNNYYHLKERLDLPAGVYILSFKSEQSVQAVKLVIE